MTNLLSQHAQMPFLSLFMDGRNAHGTHLLPMPGDRIGCADAIKRICDVDLFPSDGLAESILKTAESMGFEVGHCIVCMWKWEKGDVENEGYFCFEGISEPLTELLWGSPDIQSRRFDAEHSKEASSDE